LFFMWIISPQLTIKPWFQINALLS
jgi:hypothetical protein